LIRVGRSLVVDCSAGAPGFDARFRVGVESAWAMGTSVALVRAGEKLALLTARFYVVRLWLKSQYP